MRKQLVAVALAVSVSATAVLLAAPVQAANSHCPSSAKGGKTIAWIDAGGVHVPIKQVSMTKSGALNPPKTNKVAAWATDWADLDATSGTTVITWHVRYGVGCPGTLNPILAMPNGATFTVTQVGQAPITYVISRRTTVKKGHYKESWFEPEGPHRLLLLTCAGLKRGTFRKTLALFADEVSR